MNLVRWDPFGEIDSLFNRVFPKALAGWPRLAFEEDGGTHFEWAPTADISETEKEYLIRAELPAVPKEDVKVTVDRGMITIEGERKQKKEDKSERFHRVESYYGKFARTFSLPDDANVDAIRCESRDGVLTVHIPRQEPAKQKAKQIKVE